MVGEGYVFSFCGHLLITFFTKQVVPFARPVWYDREPLEIFPFMQPLSPPFPL